MKFSLIVLLGLCAFASSTSEIFQDIPEVNFISYEPIVFPRTGDVALPAIINNYMEKTTMDFNGLIQRFKDFSSKVRNDVETYVGNKSQQISEKAATLVQDITDLAKKGPKYAVCGKQHQNEVFDITSAVQVGLKECTTEIVAALKVFATEIASASTVLVTDFMRLKDIVVECYGKTTVGAAKCIWDNFNELKTVIGELITGTKAAIDTFTLQGKELVESVKKCNENHVQTTLVKYQNIKQILIECAKN